MPTAIIRLGRKLGLYPRGSLLSQAKSFLHLIGRAPNFLERRYRKTRRRTKVSFKTAHDRWQSVERIARDLMVVAPQLRRLCDLTQAHVYCLLQVWRERGVGVSFVKNNLGYLRTLLWFCVLPGLDVSPVAIEAAIAGIVPKNVVALTFMGLPTRRKYTDNRKAWELFHLDPLQVILEKIYPVDPVIGTVLALCVVYGFRLKEAMLFDVMKCVLRRGAGVRVLRGSKTGRRRDVQRRLGVTERMVLALARLHRNPATGTLIPGNGDPEGRELKKFRRRIYWLMERLGLTQAGRGVTIHGLRHSAACRWFKELTGVAAPIMGGTAIDAVLDAKAREIIAERLGHGRLSVVAVYCGSSLTYGEVAARAA